jgi:hypothetical protein
VVSMNISIVGIRAQCWRSGNKKFCQLAPAVQYLSHRSRVHVGQEEPRRHMSAGFHKSPRCYEPSAYNGTKVGVGGRDRAITILDFSRVDILQQVYSIR